MPGESEPAQRKFLRRVDDGTAAGGVMVDVVEFLAVRGSMVSFVRRPLSATASRPAQLGCFGLHEWAMVHRSEHHGQRHDQVPLRLGAAETERWWRR